jgi:lipopolysaccharide export system ATP-binding protein
MYITAKPDRLELKAIHFQYPKQEEAVLHELSLEISSGQIIGLIGRNGVGKSTLFRCISGEYSLTASQHGQIFLDGQDISHLALWQRVGLGLCYLPQRGGLFDDLTIKQHFELTLSPQYPPKSIFHKLLGIKSSELQLAVNQQLIQSGFEHKAQQQVKGLSGGERKRLMIYSYLCRPVKLLLMDEPFTALDQAHLQALILLIKTRVQQGVSVLICDHQEQLLKSFCDQIYLLEKGKLKKYDFNEFYPTND